MSLLTHGARGASAYTPDDYLTRPQSESIQFTNNSSEEGSRTWAELIDDLLSLRNLPDDWDGQGASAPHPAIVDGAIRWAQWFRAEQVEPADRVIAGVNGTILFEWFGSPGYAEAEVVTPDRAEVRLVVQGAQQAEEFFLTLSQH